MPRPSSRRHRPHHHHRNRSRLALLLSRQHPQRNKTLLLFVGGCLLYGYAFFYCQPDRSYEIVKHQNDELKLREKLRQDQIRAQRNGEDLDIVAEVRDDGPEWQRKMRAGGAGEMAWKREQEQLAAAGHSNLRGADGGRRKRNGGGGAASAILDFLVMMSIFVITRTCVRACLFYRQFSRIIQAQGGMPPPPPIPIPLIPNNNNNNNTTTRNRNGNNNNENEGRAALARLMVPQTNHFAALLRNARFRAWVNQLNEQREQNGQPPLSSDTLRLMMRDTDFDGDDYEALMQFHEEATLVESMGATQLEIDRYCPKRTLLDPNDDLLTTNPDLHHDRRHMPQDCAICLEKFQLHDQVRRLPCLHEFHVECIDPWLQQKAVCPICKTPIMG